MPRVRRAFLPALALGTVAWLFGGSRAHARADEGCLPAARVVGRQERVALVGASGGAPLVLPAKVDTGAETSSLHAEEIVVRGQGAAALVSFVVEAPGGRARFERPLARRAVVKSSNGERQRRLFVDLEICLGGETLPVQVSLANRSAMEFPLLLGRRFLEGRFLVDVAREARQGEPRCR